jgi:hypothetical protein
VPEFVSDAKEPDGQGKKKTQELPYPYNSWVGEKNEVVVLARWYRRTCEKNDVLESLKP